MNAVTMTSCKKCLHNYWLLESWCVPYMYFGTCPKCGCSNVFFGNDEAKKQWEAEKPTNPEHPAVYHVYPTVSNVSEDEPSVLEAVGWLEDLYKLQDTRTARRIRAGVKEI